MRPDVLDRLAAAGCDAFFEAAGEAVRWRSAREDQRATFREVAAAAVGVARSLGRAGGMDRTPAVAMACSDAFLGGADCPRWLRVRYDWRTGVARAEARPVFMAVAAAILAEGAALRLARERRAAA